MNCTTFLMWQRRREHFNDRQLGAVCIAVPVPCYFEVHWCLRDEPCISTACTELSENSGYILVDLKLIW